MFDNFEAQGEMFRKIPERIEFVLESGISPPHYEMIICLSFKIRQEYIFYEFLKN
jgi:hypothetical protein